MFLIRRTKVEDVPTLLKLARMVHFISLPADKDIMLVMQSYDRNGEWPNIATLKDLQIPTYLHAYDDPRVIA
ncbi:MAG: hypothetical protein IIC49_06945, partial [Planctomycetes bacterium]|nr:hypothetical protein [Planctomycetota bacterium]